MIYCRLINFPNTKVRATVTETEEGDSIIFVNARIATNQQMRAYLHELRHRAKRDFEKFDVQEIEKDAHS